MTTVRERAAATPAPPTSRTRRRPGTRAVVFVVLLAVYAACTVLVLVPSWVGDVDRYLFSLYINRDHLSHGETRTLFWYLTIGQRAPILVAFIPWFVWISWRRRTLSPLVAFLLAELLLNLSVGIVKVITGRIGPRETSDVHDVFAGGNIYPSGHVSNAVVIWGLTAMLVVPRLRRLWTGIAIWVSLSVGIGTVVINTHWFSDVVGGWLAGGLVLVVLPWIVPTTDRLLMRGYDRLAPRVLPQRVRDAIDTRRESLDDDRGSHVQRVDPGQFGRPRP